MSAKHPKLNAKAQAKHDTAQHAKEATEMERAANPGAKIIPKSYFTVKMQSVHDTVIDRVKKGDFTEEAGMHGVKKLIVSLDKPVGKAYNVNTKKMEDSRSIAVTYSKKDEYHIYPQGKNKG